MAYNPNAPYSPNFPASGDKSSFAPPPEMNIVSIIFLLIYFRTMRIKIPGQFMHINELDWRNIEFRCNRRRHDKVMSYFIISNVI